MGDLIDLFPQYFSSIQFVEGEKYSPDSVIRFNYRFGKKLSTLLFSFYFSLETFKNITGSLL